MLTSYGLCWNPSLGTWDTGHKRKPLHVVHALLFIFSGNPSGLTSDRIAKTKSKELRPWREDV